MKAKNRLAQLYRKDKMRIAGLMSGTSADGVDAAIIDIRNNKVRLLAFDTFAYPLSLRQSILELGEQNTLTAEKKLQNVAKIPQT